jgi:hypothetical protein
MTSPGGGQARWVKMMSSGGKLTAQACHTTKDVKNVNMCLKSLARGGGDI